MTQRSKPGYLLIGEILRPHGIRGELRMRVLTDYPERIEGLGHVYLGTGPESHKITRHPVEHMRMHKEYGLLKLADVADRSQADFMRGLYVMIPLEQAIPLKDDEIYLFQLIGMQVQTEDNRLLGEITDVIETGANDVYIIDSPDYGEVLIPITEETLLDTDPDSGVVTVRLPDGLLPGLQVSDSS